MIATDSQILESIRDFIEEHGYSPTIRELCEAVGIRSPGSMKYRIDRLRSEGMLSYDSDKPRTIRVVEHD